MQKTLIVLPVILAGLAACANAQFNVTERDIIHACAQKQNGQLRVVDDPSECRPSEEAISWNRTGPAAAPEEPCCEERYQFVGFSEGDTQGGAGILKFTQMCQATHPGSRICNSEEFMLTTDLPAEVSEPVTAPASFGWVRPTAIVGRGASIGIASIVGLQGEVEDFSCAGWYQPGSSSLSSNTGLSVNRYGQFLLSGCSGMVSLKVACCAVVADEPQSIIKPR